MRSAGGRGGLYLRDRRMKLAVVKYIHTPLGAGQPNKLLGKKS